MKLSNTPEDIKQFFQAELKKIRDEINKIEVENAGEDCIKLKALEAFNKTGIK